VNVEFIDSNVPQHLPRDVSLCLFRVAQEALQNAVKYSGTGQFTVELSATGSEARLLVKDKGTGFDVEEARRNRGLGLVSMQERVHLVHGRLSIESKHGAGTTILAVVPLAAKNQRASDDREVRDTASMPEVA
jgi:signal transduction histidine kinase